MRCFTRFAAGLLLAGCACAAQPDFTRARAIVQEMLDHGIASVSLAAAEDGKIVWEEGFGWADRERKMHPSPDTMYSLASITKPFTATALMVLRERKKIGLDRPVNRYLGEAKLIARVGRAKDATMRRVASHSAGLPTHYQFFYADEPYQPSDRDETIRRYGNLVTAPGERYEYSNLGYGVLDYVISRVSGRSYADFMRDEVFQPLGLRHTSVDVPPALAAFQAARYAPEGIRLPNYGFDHPGASAIFASAHDLVRFGMFHVKAHLADQKQILPDASIDEMQKPVIAVDRPEASYGVGWFTQRTPSGENVVWHTGGMGGVSDILELVPARKIAVVVLTNTHGERPYQLSHAILSAMIPGFIPGAPAPDPKPAEFHPPAGLAGRWEGRIHTYQGDRGFRLTIGESGAVRARVGAQAAAAVTNVRLGNGYLTGTAQGDLDTSDANRRPYLLELSLKQRGDVLNGAVTAVSLPAPKTGNGLSHWVELKRRRGRPD